MSQSQFNTYMGLSQQELQQSQDQYNQQMSMQSRALDQADAANAVSKSVADAQIQSMNQSMQYASQDRDRYNSVEIPLQDQYIQAAKDYNTPEKQAAAAAQALADNQTQLEAQRSNTASQLASMGVDPSQVMSTSLANQMGVAGAASGAMQANQARQNTIDTGYNMLANAVNMGNNLPAQSIQNTQAATNAGNSAAGNINSSTANYNSASGIGQTASGIRQSSLNTAQGLTGSPMAWASLGNQSYGGASNGIMNSSSIQNQMFQNQMSAQAMKNQQSQATMSAIGSVASIAGMAMMAEGGAVSDQMPDVDWRSMAQDPSVAAPQAQYSVRDQAPGSVSAIKAPPMGDAASSGTGRGIMMAGQMMSKAANTPAFSDSNMQQQFLRPVMRAEGGMIYRAEGGGIPAGSMGAMPLQPQAQAGPMVSPHIVPSVQSRDKIPAVLSPGEMVIPADVVRMKGQEFFQKMIAKHHRPGA